MTVWCSMTWLSTLPSRIVGVGMGGRVPPRLSLMADAQAAGRIRRRGQRCAGRSWCDRWGWGKPRAPQACINMRAVRFLIVADAHHVDRAVHSEEAAGESEGAAPLSGPRLSGQPLDAGALVVVGLRHRRCWACWLPAGLVPSYLLIDCAPGIERLFRDGARGRDGVAASR